MLEKSITVHDLSRHATSMTRLQLSLLSTDMTQNCDKLDILRRNRVCKGSNVSNDGANGSSSLPLSPLLVS